ncbi:beta-lactamase [Kaistella solincola]|uniref:Beta-lactamase n=1 Tax=Kaistella solincola TaxID=510955 RepID=A0ABR4ZT84_9FLAO|nr:beta-lactamase [Kaistella solincola]
MFSLFACKAEAEKVVNKTAERNAIIDSTITVFQKQLLKSQIDSVFTKTNFNGSVSVHQNGKILYEKINGFENFKNKKPLDSNSVFAIASLSKQFTAVLILLQEENGKLKTDDFVSKYLKEFEPKQFEKITIKELLNHTSGIRDFDDGLHSKPGEEFNYSNKGFYNLGKIIEIVSGKSYDENLNELFKKVGMNHSFTANNFDGKHFASAYLGTAKNFSEVPNMPERLSARAISVPAGGILSTLNNLHRWNNALYTGKIINQASLKKFLEQSAEREHAILGKMGYGFGIMTNFAQPTAYFHTGYVKGSASLSIYYPESGTSVVILSNIADESRGKSAVFISHKRIKEITESLENATVSVKETLKKTAL